MKIRIKISIKFKIKIKISLNFVNSLLTSLIQNKLGENNTTSRFILKKFHKSQFNVKLKVIRYPIAKSL